MVLECDTHLVTGLRLWFGDDPSHLVSGASFTHCSCALCHFVQLSWDFSFMFGVSFACLFLQGMSGPAVRVRLRSMDDGMVKVDMAACVQEMMIMLHSEVCYR